MQMYGHVITAMNSTTYAITGGLGSFRKTFYYSENNQKWITGPELTDGRRQHAAGLGIDTTTSEHYIAVTGGIGNSGCLDSVEICYMGDTAWQIGKQVVFHF